MFFEAGPLTKPELHQVGYQLAREPQESSHFYYPSAGVTGICHHAPLTLLEWCMYGLFSCLDVDALYAHSAFGAYGGQKKVVIPLNWSLHACMANTVLTD